ncbi:MAG TPA: hypothetical protein VMH80_03780 [Bryobacteraceae bacterium]|nr:hypothetical protein [Bryobacteraceae bacterium]
MAKITIRLIVAGLMLTALTVYAVENKSGERWAHYTFEFGGRGENIGIEVLDWKFGDAPFSFMRAPNRGRIPQSDNVAGKMPLADSLYVKWRVLATGNVYEDKVNLKSRLPSNMEDKTIHFMVEGSHLNVYVIEDLQVPHARNAPDCLVADYRTCKCSRIYPDYWSNFDEVKS